MTEQPQRTRVRVEDPTPEPDPARTGCLWAGGILGVIVGVIVTFLAVPQILNFLFPSETIEVGETFEDSKLTIQVGQVLAEELEIDPGGRPAYVVSLTVEARSTWSAKYAAFVLVLEDDTELHARARSRSHDEPDFPDDLKVPQGTSTLELLFFDVERMTLAPPDSLHLEEPPVKFELPAPVTP